MDVSPDAADAQFAIWQDELAQVHELLELATDALRVRDFKRAHETMRQADLLRRAIELTMYEYERACGRSWLDIGGIRGLSKQAAFNRYKRLAQK